MNTAYPYSHSCEKQNKNTGKILKRQEIENICRGTKVTLELGVLHSSYNLSTLSQET
jgi:hypothetical protein